MSAPSTKQVVLSQVVEDLNSGLTRWKKDDIGFGSLEKKYGLTLQEMIQLLAHPRVQEVETRIPTFVIVDDLTEPETVTETPLVEETRIQVAPVVQEVKQRPQTTVVVRKQEVVEEEVLTAFI